MENVHQYKSRLILRNVKGNCQRCINLDTELEKATNKIAKLQRTCRELRKQLRFYEGANEKKPFQQEQLCSVGLDQLISDEINSHLHQQNEKSEEIDNKANLDWFSQSFETINSFENPLDEEKFDAEKCVEFLNANRLFECKTDPYQSKESVSINLNQYEIKSELQKSVAIPTRRSTRSERKTTKGNELKFDDMLKVC